MRTVLLTITASLSLMSLLASCGPIEDNKQESLPDYSSVKVQPEQDSLFFTANKDSRQFSLIGALVTVNEKTITNSGVMTDTRYTVRTVDTVYQSVNPSSATWITSDPNIVTVSKGLVVAKNPGVAAVAAVVGRAISQNIIITVRAENTAPGLSLTPPDLILQLVNSVPITGATAPNAVVSMNEPRSSFSVSPVTVSGIGAFSTTVTGLQEGYSTVTVRAANPVVPSLYTERSKRVIYYPPFTIAADSIVGNWLGTTLGKEFHFAIQRSALVPFRYDITGTIDIDFTSLGMGLKYVKDINLVGFLNGNGSIDVALSKSTGGFTISGTFTGHFESTGKGKGTYSAQAVRSGWPKIAFNDVWSAVKVP